MAPTPTRVLPPPQGSRPTGAPATAPYLDPPRTLRTGARGAQERRPRHERRHNPPRALAFQMQKRLGLMSLPKVELVMPGMAVASMSNVEDYLAVTANPTLKLCKPGPASMPGGRAALSPTDTRRPTIGRAWRRLHNGERQRLGGSAGVWQGLEVPGMRSLSANSWLVDGSIFRTTLPSKG